MKIERIDRVLNHPAIILIEPPNPAEFFERRRRFKTSRNDGIYEITWWKNISYFATLGEDGDSNSLVLFDHVDISGTWPWRSRFDLRFTYQDELSCVLKIEKYPGG